MSTEPDPLLRDLDRLRRLKGLRPLTPEEADAELAKTPGDPFTDEEIERMVSSATAAALGDRNPFPERVWDPDNELPSLEAEGRFADHDRHALLLNIEQDDDGDGNAQNTKSLPDQDNSVGRDEAPPDGGRPGKPTS